MPKDFKEIFREAAGLPERDRATLAGLLIESPEPEPDAEVEAAWAQEVRRLQTIPGIGPVLAPVIWSEIGRLDRFSSASALVNYTGLVPSLYESGEVSVQGSITHQGSAWLRWGLIAAANSVVRGNSPFADRYHRLRRRKKPTSPRPRSRAHWRDACMEF